MSNIHPTAIIDPNAKIADDVKIGAFTIIGKNVEIGSGCEIQSHVVIEGNTKIGKNNKIFSFAAIGKIPQDLKFKGEESRLIIGDNNIIREYATLHPGTQDDRMETVVGSNCLFMIGVHVAHDCIVGDKVIMANNATLAGHVVVEDFAIIGGLSAVRQFVRIGKHAMIGGMSAIEQDIIPFSLVVGERAKLAGLNLVGLERRGFEKDDIKSLRKAYKQVFENREHTLAERLAQVETDLADQSALVRDMLDFAKEKSRVGLCPSRQS